MNNKNYAELAVILVEAWLKHESEVSQEMGRTATKGKSISVKEVAQAYLDISNTISTGNLPDNLKDPS